MSRFRQFLNKHLAFSEENTHGMLVIKRFADESGQPLDFEPSVPVNKGRFAYNMLVVDPGFYAIEEITGVAKTLWKASQESPALIHKGQRQYLLTHGGFYVGSGDCCYLGEFTIEFKYKYYHIPLLDLISRLFKKDHGQVQHLKLKVNQDNMSAFKERLKEKELQLTLKMKKGKFLEGGVVHQI